MKNAMLCRQLIHFGIFIFILSFNLTKSISQITIPTDHHVHFFSPQLLSQLKLHKFGAAQFKKPGFLYSNIDSILKYNEAEHVWLISAGYAFRQAADNIQTEIQLQLQEQNMLSNAAFKYPKRIKAIYGVNPSKTYAIQLIKRCHRHLNFDGIKLHFHASHIDFRKTEHTDALTEIFQYTGQHDIPVLIHFPNHKSDFGKSEVDYFFNYILPEGLAQTLIFAHLGSGGWLTEKSVVILDSIVDNVNQSSTKHLIKFEISGIVSHQNREFEKLSDDRKLALLRKVGFKNLLFGSDYPLTTSQSYFNTVLDRLKLTKREKKSLKNNYVDL